jgi:serine/threonine-protein kinase
MLYEMLVGQLPFDAPSFTTMVLQHITTPPPPPRQLNPALNEATEAVLLKALHKSPEKRYKTAGQLIEPKPPTAATPSSTRQSSLATRTATSPSRKQPAISAPPSTQDPGFTYKRMLLVAGGVIILIVIPVLILWLLNA